MIVNQTHTLPLIRQLAPFEQKPLLNVAFFGADLQPNVFSVVHETHYQYTRPVVASKHLFRLQPVHDLEQHILNYKLEVSSEASQVCNFTGAFGNHASFIEISEPYMALSFRSESVVCVTELSKNIELSHQPRTMPLIWMPWDRVMMQAYLQTPELPESELFALSEYAMSFVQRNHNNVFAVLNDMNLTIYKEFTYSAGSTNLLTTPYQVLQSKQGVCQDFANLLICLARLLNIPARYRMGYVYTGGNYENKIQSDASHAWVEVYLPYLGWIGFDPTNGCIAGKNHIRVAVGRHYLDATPTSGSLFTSEGETKETLTVSVKVVLLNPLEM